MEPTMFALLTAAFLSVAAASDDPLRQISQLDVDAFTDAPLQIELLAHVEVPPEELFALVSVDLPRWFVQIPSVAWDDSRSAVPGTHAAGSVRSCALGDDHLVEDIVHWEDGHVYGYMVDTAQSTAAPPIRDHLGVFMIEADGSGGSLLTWRQFYSRRVTVMAPMVNLYLRGLMEDGLDQLVEIYGGEVLAAGS